MCNILFSVHRLRDMLNLEKQENQRSSKQLEKQEGELGVLRKDKDRLLLRNAEHEKEVIELKEQVSF